MAVQFTCDRCGKPFEGGSMMDAGEFQIYMNIYRKQGGSGDFCTNCKLVILAELPRSDEWPDEIDDRGDSGRKPFVWRGY